MPMRRVEPTKKIPLTDEQIVLFNFFPWENSICDECSPATVRECTKRNWPEGWWDWYEEQKEESDAS